MVDGEVADTDVFIGVPGGVAVTGTVKGVSAGNGRMFLGIRNLVWKALASLNSS